jgi:uncharacterized protein YoaH (UPF0181 family)
MKETGSEGVGMAAALVAKNIRAENRNLVVIKEIFERLRV